MTAIQIIWKRLRLEASFKIIRNKSLKIFWQFFKFVLQPLILFLFFISYQSCFLFCFVLFSDIVWEKCFLCAFVLFRAVFKYCSCSPEEKAIMMCFPQTLIWIGSLPHAAMLWVKTQTHPTARTHLIALLCSLFSLSLSLSQKRNNRHFKPMHC